MGAIPFSPIRWGIKSDLRRAVIVLVTLLASGGFAVSVQAETSRITVTTGPQVAQQSKIVRAGADQTIRIVIADPVRPGIRRAPVAEPVIYVIEADDTVRPVR